VAAAVKAKPAEKSHTADKRTRLFLSRRDAEILQTVHVYRFLTALDIAARHFSPASETYVRKLLLPLCGGADEAQDHYLYRFQLPHVGPGNSQRVYTLGSRGRDFLAQEVGWPVAWHFRPQKVKNASFAAIMHNLILTRCLVAAERWASNCPLYNLVRMRTCYELAASSPHTSQTQVIPDAWLLFERRAGGAHVHFAPVLLEIDRGTEYKERFQDHIRSRLEFVRSGAYRAMFGTEWVTIAYATTGQTLAQGQARRHSMCEWTMELLHELQRALGGKFPLHQCVV
jgi:Replication-relaxation